MDLQSVWFEAGKYTEAEAAEWCVDHDLKTDDVGMREEEDLITHWIFRQFPTSEAIEDTWQRVSKGWPDGITATMCERKAMDESKGYSTFQIKSFDEEQRIIRGIASTPETDREGDIVMPKGAKFTLPFPLLAQHDHNQPVGMVTKASVSDAGIEIEAQLPKDSQLSYVERTWRQVKAGLLRGLSIGFRATKAEAIKTGRKFLDYEIFELSLVTVPANAGASVSTVKQYDDSEIDLEQQLLSAEAEISDAVNRAAAAIEKATQLTTKQEA